MTTSTVYVVLGVRNFEMTAFPSLRVFSSREDAVQYGESLVLVPDEDGDTFDSYTIVEQHVL